MARYGPKYLFLGSRLSDDTYLLRAILEGLNTWARQWGETLIILDNGSLPGLENEVEDFRYLEHRPIKTWQRPNIVLAFMDTVRQSGTTRDWLLQAEQEGVAAFVISPYRHSTYTHR
jgi:hypothetical protein